MESSNSKKGNNDLNLDEKKTKPTILQIKDKKSSNFSTCETVYRQLETNKDKDDFSFHMDIIKNVFDKLEESYESIIDGKLEDYLNNSQEEEDLQEEPKSMLDNLLINMYEDKELQHVEAGKIHRNSINSNLLNNNKSDSSKCLYDTYSNNQSKINYLHKPNNEKYENNNDIYYSNNSENRKVNQKYQAMKDQYQRYFHLNLQNMPFFTRYNYYPFYFVGNQNNFNIQNFTSTNPRPTVSLSANTINNYSPVNNLMTQNNFNCVDIFPLSNRRSSTFNIKENIEKLLEENACGELLSESEKIVFKNVNLVSNDQTLCRKLQDYLDKRLISNSARSLLLDLIKPNIVKISSTQFGNYLIQKFIEFCDATQLLELLENFKPYLLAIAMNCFGTRVIQSLFIRLYDLSSANSKDCLKGNMKKFSDIINPHLVQLMTNSNSLHLIILYISKANGEDLATLYECLISNFLEISTSKNGCCFVQKILKEENSYNIRIHATIFKNATSLLLDEFGHYIVQYLINLSPVKFAFKFVILIKDNFLIMINNKYSAAVIEKILTNNMVCNLTKEILVKQILRDEIFNILIYKEFGHYIIQKSLKVAQPPYFNKLLAKVNRYKEILLTMTSGIKLLKKISSETPRYMSIRHDLID